MKWLRSKAAREADEAFERSLKDQQEMAREERAERRRAAESAAKSERITREYYRPTVWVDPDRR